MTKEILLIKFIGFFLCNSYDKLCSFLWICIFQSPFNACKRESQRKCKLILSVLLTQDWSRHLVVESARIGNFSDQILLRYTLIRGHPQLGDC